MRHGVALVPLALVTLRAYPSAPARVELIYQPLPGRVLRMLLALGVFWGGIPLLMWIPPHYPWVIGSFLAGLFLAYRQWTGRYLVRFFAGICPRCGNPLSLSPDHCISLPHTLTCYRCHFEPRLEVNFAVDAERTEADLPEHRLAECAGRWELRWLADEPFMVCNQCHSGCRATPEVRRAAQAENECADLLLRLTREGRSIL